MTPLEGAKAKLSDMLKKYHTAELSIELQTLYTLVEAAINVPIAMAEGDKIRQEILNKNK